MQPAKRCVWGPKVLLVRWAGLDDASCSNKTHTRHQLQVKGAFIRKRFDLKCKAIPD